MRVQHGIDVGAADNRTVEVRLQGWEEFDEPVDRIVSIGAFEAFKAERYPVFFQKAYDILPADGRMLLHTITAYPQKYFVDNGIKITMSDLKFMRFMGTEIFPGGQLPAVEDIESLAAGSGFTLGECSCYSLTTRARSTCGRRTWPPTRTEAIAITSVEVYDRYMKYLTGCADFFHRGISNVGQFTLVKG